MTGTRVYQGWRYTFDEARPAKERWVATRKEETMVGPTEPGIKKLIDLSHEEVSQKYRAPARPELSASL